MLIEGAYGMGVWAGARWCWLWSSSPSLGAAALPCLLWLCSPANKKEDRPLARVSDWTLRASSRAAVAGPGADTEGPVADGGDSSGCSLLIGAAATGTAAATTTAAGCAWARGGSVCRPCCRGSWGAGPERALTIAGLALARALARTSWACCAETCAMPPPVARERAASADDRATTLRCADAAIVARAADTGAAGWRGRFVAVAAAAVLLLYTIGCDGCAALPSSVLMGGCCRCCRCCGMLLGAGTGTGTAWGRCCWCRISILWYEWTMILWRRSLFLERNAVHWGHALLGTYWSARCPRTSETLHRTGAFLRMSLMSSHGGLTVQQASWRTVRP
mmetsp:Transcript_16095/g.33029  ORF Transcript_16095/g.33029 Transcript_16095/m.33029 type:complete len:335 (-) Transcript_16095:240-1244(-)